MTGKDGVKRIILEVTPSEDQDRGTVKMFTEEGVEFVHLMSACEFLLNITANESSLSYSEACNLLVAGSKTYDRHLDEEESATPMEGLVFGHFHIDA